MQAAPTKAQIRQSIKDFLTEQSSHSKPKLCRCCGLSMQFLPANFQLRGSVTYWTVSLPFCPACDREMLREASQAETIH